MAGNKKWEGQDGTEGMGGKCYHHQMHSFIQKAIRKRFESLRCTMETKTWWKKYSVFWWKVGFTLQVKIYWNGAALCKSSWACGKFENNLMFPKSGGLARYSKPATANLGSFRKLRWLIPPLCAGDKEGWRGAHCWQVAEVRIMSGRVWTQLATSGSRFPAAERGRGVQLSNLSWCKVEKCNYKKWEPVCRV